MPDQLFCSLRKRWIKASPEEKIRQLLINYLTTDLQYPLHQIVIERSLDSLPHLEPALLSHIPIRRLDLLVLAKDLHPLYPFYPLLLIECKATSIDNKAMRQVLSYNYFLKACFIAIANQYEIQMGWRDSLQSLNFQKGLPSYPALLAQAKQLILQLP